MKHWCFCFIFALLLLVACNGRTAEIPFTVTITNAARIKASPQMADVATTDSVSPQSSATAAISPTALLTATVTVTSPAPTETLLPPLDIPTEKPNAPARVAWTGVPTYAGDSEPGRLFQVDYDPDLWAQTKDNYEQVVLAHRKIEYCTITAWSGRGLPAEAKAEHVFGQVGDIPYDINYITMGGKMKFATYVGGDKRLLTGFQVSFETQREQCALDAEAILATLHSFTAQPTITPTFTPEPLESATATP